MPKADSNIDVNLPENLRRLQDEIIVCLQDGALTGADLRRKLAFAFRTKIGPTDLYLALKMLAVEQKLITTKKGNGWLHSLVQEVNV